MLEVGAGQYCTAINILVVHGMGEQRPNEYRNSVAESLVQVWQRKYGCSNVVEVCDRSAQQDKQLCQKCKCDKCKCDDCITILIKSCDDSSASTKVEVREVYWADLDESPRGPGQSIMHALRFWCWGLSQWAAKRYRADPKLLERLQMLEPVPKGGYRIPLSVRLRLFGVGIAFALLGVTWELLRFVARRLRIAIVGSSVLVRYLGDVQLYTENRYRFRPADLVKLTDAPRDAIRRRMISALLQMAMKKYDRWYVVAHSMGTVVAHNGLMELAETLPNYLRREGMGTRKKTRRVDDGGP